MDPNAAIIVTLGTVIVTVVGLVVWVVKALVGRLVVKFDELVAEIRAERESRAAHERQNADRHYRLKHDFKKHEENGAIHTFHPRNQP